MDGVARVGQMHRPRQRLDQPGGLRRRQRPGLQPLRQAAALDVLQGAEGQAAGLADLVDLHDVGVRQPRRRLRLRLEASALGRAGVASVQDHLQGDGALEGEVGSPVDDAHAAATEHALDLVAGHLGAGVGGRRALAGPFGAGGLGVVRGGGVRRGGEGSGGAVRRPLVHDGSLLF